MKTSLEFDRFTDTNGRPICAKNFETGEVCTFLGCSGMCGKNDVCLFPSRDGPTPVSRKNFTGFIQIHDACPLWKSTQGGECTVTCDVVNIITREVVARRTQKYPNVVVAVNYITTLSDAVFCYENVVYSEEVEG